MPIRRSVLLAALLTLTACDNSKADQVVQVERDPAVTGALSDPLMADPDLTSQSRAGAALSGGGPPSGELPPYKRGAEEVAAARAAAASLLGGSIASAPAATASEAASLAVQAPTAVALARALPWTRACADRLAYSAIWAARLPPRLGVYPRAHVGEAAGSDAVGCKVRVVGFVTPVAVRDLVDFYHASALAAGLPAKRHRAGTDEVIGGTRGTGGWSVFVRAREDGMSEAQLVTAGL